MKSRLAAAGIALIIFMAVLALLAPLLAPYDPAAIDLGADLDGPSAAHPLGCDDLGRDILSRLLYGARTSLCVGLVVVLISAAVGTALGAAAGYSGGAADIILMRLVDILMAFPGILLAIAVAGILGPSLVNVIIALCALGWVSFARLVRGQVLAIKERDFVAAARAMGAGPVRIVARHIMPEVLAPVMVQATFAVAGAILAESSLSFLGLGPQDYPTWGSMLSEGVEFLLFAPHMSTWPGLALCVTVLAFNFLGDGLRDRLDVRA